MRLRRLQAPGNETEPANGSDKMKAKTWLLDAATEELLYWPVFLIMKIESLVEGSHVHEVWGTCD